MTLEIGIKAPKRGIINEFLKNEITNNNEIHSADLLRITSMRWWRKKSLHLSSVQYALSICAFCSICHDSCLKKCDVWITLFFFILFLVVKISNYKKCLISFLSNNEIGVFGCNFLYQQTCEHTIYDWWKNSWTGHRLFKSALNRNRVRKKYMFTAAFLFSFLRLHSVKQQMR